MKSIKSALANIPWMLKFRYFLSAFRAPLTVIVSSRNKMKKYRRKYSGKRCFIIGNGPSLKAADLDKLKNEITFAANQIYKIFPQTDWRPTFYCVQDEEVLLGMDSEEFKSTVEAVQLSFVRMHSCHKIRQKRIHISNACYVPIFNDRTKPTSSSFTKDASKYIYDGGTVTYMSMQLAAYMGFSEIYLLGVDHNFPYRIDLNGETAVNDLNLLPHFYSVSDDKNERVLGNYHEFVTNCYQAAEDYSREDGTFRIYNATRGGVLEVFERVDLDKVVKR